MNHRLATGYDFKPVFDLYMNDGANPYLTYDPMSEQDFVPIYNELVGSHTLYVVEMDKAIVATYRLIPKSGETISYYLPGQLYNQIRTSGQGYWKEGYGGYQDKGYQRREETT